jgi:hypothetical protein
MLISIKYLVPAGALVGLLLASPAGWARDREDEGEDSLISREPYVQMATPSSVTIVWRTEQRISPVVRYGRSLEKLSQQVADSNIVTRISLGTNKHTIHFLTNHWPELIKTPRLHSAPPGTFQYEALVPDLAPDTSYYYAVFDGEVPLTDRDATYRFRTHPMVGTPRKTRFWAVGDSGTGRTNQHVVLLAMLDFTAKQKHPIDFALHLGDMAYSRGRDPEFQTRFFGMYAEVLRNTVCWATFGNHEGSTSKSKEQTGPYYDAYVCPTNAQAGGVPSGTEAYYSFDYGRTHFISLNSFDIDRKPTGVMAKWVQDDMEKTRADWVIAFFHHPPYTKGSHDSDREKHLIEMRTYMMPILEERGVDLVLTGHSHIYERSMLLDGAYATPTVSENAVLDDGDGDPKGDGAYRKSAGVRPNLGTVQIVAGHGGTTLRRKATSPVMKKTILEHGSVLIDIDGNTLTGTMIDRYGDNRDTFQIVKRSRLSPQRLAFPWMPALYKQPKSPDGDELASEPPEDFIAVIPLNAEWEYLAGDDPDGDAWTKLKFDAKGWKAGEAGFGYNGPGLRTELPRMQGDYSRLYIRHEFEVEQADQISDIGIMISYDDGFIAYLNGKEVIRRNVGKGSGAKAGDIKAHEAGKYHYYPLKDFEKNLKEGRNVLAIEGHNIRADSNDFVLDPYLIIED